MPIKLTLQRIITSYSECSKPQYAWVFRQESYTRHSWETFNIPAVCGVAGVYIAYIPDEVRGKICMKYYRQKLKEKALQELEEAMQNIEKQIDSLENAK